MSPYFAERLLKLGSQVANARHYLEALDLFDEAADILEALEMGQSSLYADVLYERAQTKIKARLQRDFPALYVKTALTDVQTSTSIRRTIQDILPLKLAEGLYLEGYIHKRFFLRNEEALDCFKEAAQIEPGFVAAKRELSELLLQTERNGESPSKD